MRSFFVRFFTWLCFAAIFEVWFCPVFAGEAELEQVKSEWPAAAQRLDKAFAQVQGKARLWHEHADRPKQSNPTEVRFAIDLGMEKVEFLKFAELTKSEKFGYRVYCVGNNTAFRIKRRTNADDYEVIGIGSAPSDENSYWTEFGRFVHAAHGLIRPMTTVFRERSFKIIGAETMGTLLKVECAWGPKDPQRRISLVLDPGSGWILRSGEFGATDDTPSHPFEIEYGPSSKDGIPLPRLVKFHEPGSLTSYCEFTDWAFAPTPISEFNMTHYGLPDLVQMRKSKNMLPYWLSGAVVLVGLTAVVFWRFWSRGARSA